MIPIENSAHAYLADEIHGHTVLYIDSAKPLELTKFWDTVPEFLQPRYRAALERALSNGRVKYGDPGEDVQSFSIPTLWIDSKADSGLGNSLQDVQIGLDEFVQGIDLPLESRREHLHPNAIAFSRILALRRHIALMNQLHLSSGLFRHEVWRSIFSPYSHELGKVTLCDRYCLAKHGMNGLEYLISRLSSSGCTSLNVYASLFEEKNAGSRISIDKEKIWRSIRHLSGIGQKNGVSIGISLGADRKFRLPAHDRYIRFQDLVFSLGSGITLFSDNRLRAHHQLSMGLYDSNLRSVEQALRKEQEISFELPFASNAREAEQERNFLEPIDT
ncbi:hypothetical protein [Synechococcus sp. L2F]|uniref:hypothetical protein n=1 Tax=Synechococcus sp. L2F TaxID=2823739 RepID=UPI0020CD2BF0|nr:hypothetical protein [Synechococcus sp. L2F]